MESGAPACGLRAAATTSCTSPRAPASAPSRWRGSTSTTSGGTRPSRGRSTRAATAARSTTSRPPRPSARSRGSTPPSPLWRRLCRAAVERLPSARARLLAERHPLLPLLGIGTAALRPAEGERAPDLTFVRCGQRPITRPAAAGRRRPDTSAALPGTASLGALAASATGARPPARGCGRHVASRARPSASRVKTAPHKLALPAMRGGAEGHQIEKRALHCERLSVKRVFSRALSRVVSRFCPRAERASREPTWHVTQDFFRSYRTYMYMSQCV